MGALQHQVEGNPNDDPPARLSFKDALASQASPSSSLFFTQPPDQPDPPSQSGTHRGYPAITFTKPHVARISASFRWSLIGKFSQGYNKSDPNLGRPPVERLQKFFESLDFKGTFQIGLMDNRHLLIQFQLQEDFLHFYSRSVWYVKGIPMRIFKWSPKFHVDKETPIAPVWISLPRLPVHFFEKYSVFAIASLIGTPLRIDSATSLLKRPSMARVQVELDLMKDRPDKVWIAIDGEDGFWQRIEYEYVPDYCTTCWHIGHADSVCHYAHPELKALRAKKDDTAQNQNLQYVPKVPKPTPPPRNPIPQPDITPKTQSLPITDQQPDSVFPSQQPEIASFRSPLPVPPSDNSPVLSSENTTLTVQQFSDSAGPNTLPSHEDLVPDSDKLKGVAASIPQLVPGVPEGQPSGLVELGVAVSDAAVAAVTLDGTEGNLRPVVGILQHDSSGHSGFVGSDFGHKFDDHGSVFPTSGLGIVMPAADKEIFATFKKPAAPGHLESECPAAHGTSLGDIAHAAQPAGATYKSVLVNRGPAGVVSQEIGFAPIVLEESVTERALVVYKHEVPANDTTLNPNATAFRLPIGTTTTTNLLDVSPPLHTHIPQNQGFPAFETDLGYHDSDYYPETLGSDDFRHEDYEHTDEHTYEDITDGSEGTHSTKKRDRRKLKGILQPLATKDELQAQSRLLGVRIRKRGRPPGSRNRTYFDVQRTMSTRATKSTSD